MSYNGAGTVASLVSVIRKKTSYNLKQNLIADADDNASITIGDTAD